MQRKIKVNIQRFYWYIFNTILHSCDLGYHIALIINSIKNIYCFKPFLNDRKAIKFIFKKTQGYTLDFENPTTMNEKMQWLKIHDRTELHTLFADKWMVRNFIKEKYGADILTELVFQTSFWNEIIELNMPDYPFIIKPNHASGWYHIIHNKNNVDWRKIKTDCRFWLSQNYYFAGREWQYKHIKPCIIVEKLLIPKTGGLPNNYRLHCLSGKVEIISVNKCFNNPNTFIARKFDREWHALDFKFGTEIKIQENLSNIKIIQPVSLNRMIAVAEDIAKQFAYIRVDFYEVDDKMYFSEITFHDSGGYDKIIPFEWDIKFGNLISIAKA